jgi:hypothetical protein
MCRETQPEALAGDRAILVKRNGNWLITAFHNTLTSGPVRWRPGHRSEPGGVAQVIVYH